jgi:hypothetical protein
MVRNFLAGEMTLIRADSGTFHMEAKDGSVGNAEFAPPTGPVPPSY